MQNEANLQNKSENLDFRLFFKFECLKFLFCLKIQCNNVQNRTHLFVQNICVTDHIKSSLTLSLPSNSWFENEFLADFLNFGWLDLFAIAGSGSSKRT